VLLSFLVLLSFGKQKNTNSFSFCFPRGLHRISMLNATVLSYYSLPAGTLDDLCRGEHIRQARVSLAADDLGPIRDNKGTAVMFLQRCRVDLID
jgi:hypothetical protein